MPGTATLPPATRPARSAAALHPRPALVACCRGATLAPALATPPGPTPPLGPQLHPARPSCSCGTMPTWRLPAQRRCGLPASGQALPTPPAAASSGGRMARPPGCSPTRPSSWCRVRCAPLCQLLLPGGALNVSARSNWAACTACAHAPPCLAALSPEFAAHSWRPGWSACASARPASGCPRFLAACGRPARSPHPSAVGE